MKARGVVARMMEAAKVKTARDLASAIGVTPQAITTWRGRDSVPENQIVRCAGILGVRPQWLRDGSGEPVEALARVSLSREETRLIECFREGTEEQRRALLDFAVDMLIASRKKSGFS